MALSTYADLKSAIAGWLDREDLSERIDDFIALAEASLAARLGIRTAEADVGLVGVEGMRTIPLPGVFRDAKRLWRLGEAGRGEIRSTLPELLVIHESPGAPHGWCVDGTAIAFDRPLDQAYDFVLRMVSAPRLDDGSPTNLTLANYPNLYLFGALREAGPYLRDAELTAAFEAKYAEALAEAKDLESRLGRRAKLLIEPIQLIGNLQVGSC